MSINITRNETQTTNTNKIVTKKTTEEVLDMYTIKQPRDEKGRFTAGGFKMEKFTDDKMRKFNETFMQPISLERAEYAAPFISNCIKDNGFLKQIARDRQLYHVLYLGAHEDSYYIFFLKKEKFGFHYNCGNFENILTAKEINTLLKNFNPLEWDSIQKA